MPQVSRGGYACNLKPSMVLNRLWCLLGRLGIGISAMTSATMWGGFKLGTWGNFLQGHEWLRVTQSDKCNSEWLRAMSATQSNSEMSGKARSWERVTFSVCLTCYSLSCSGWKVVLGPSLMLDLLGVVRSKSQSDSGPTCPPLESQCQVKFSLIWKGW